MKTPAARAIVIKDGKLLAIKRQRDGKKYMVIPGGHIESGESPEHAVIREVPEETTIEISNPKLVFIEEHKDEGEHADDKWGTQYIFICNYIEGEAVLNPLSEEHEIQQKGLGSYEPVWFDVSSLPDKEYPFLSERLGEEIVTGFKAGFPAEVKKWHYDSL